MPFDIDTSYPIEAYSPERIKGAYLIVHPKILERYNITRADFYGVFERGSNFSQLKYPITDDYWNIFYDSEWYYMAERFNDLEIKKAIAQASKIKWHSKKVAYKYREIMNQNDTDRIEFMREAIKRKYDESKWRRWLLQETGTREIIEFTYWGDRFFGIDSTDRTGRNILGKIHMQYRDTM